MSFASAKLAQPAAKPSLVQDIKQDGFFTGIADYVKDRLGSHEEQVSMVQQHKIEASNEAAEEAVIRQEITDGAVNAETTAKPGIAEDISHDGLIGGVMDWVKDSLPGHSDKPAAMYHQEFGEAPPKEALREIVAGIEYVPSNVRPTRPLTQGTVISQTKVTKDDLVAQGRFFELPPVRLPPVTETRTLAAAPVAKPAMAVPLLGSRAAMPATMISAPATITAPTPIMAAPTTVMAAPRTTVLAAPTTRISPGTATIAGSVTGSVTLARVIG